MTEVQTIDADGGAIPYVDEGSGPAVVLLPSSGRDVHYLGMLAASLIAEDFRVVRIGWPESGADASAMADHAADVVAVMDALDLDHAWVGGHAFGGSVARAVSHAHHDRVNGVLLLGVDDPEATLADGIPVLVIQGEADDVTPPANGEALKDAAPGLVSVVAIDGAGHMFAETHVGATSWAIEDYLDWD
ncbi:hypothetical protein GCM10022200_08830 [Microbacterium awajiense]|uniref:Alpha/beta hydrolase fold-5 domain-containing protein n=1 Tax=Microbacterium awajiense TaxID=415214 RepID=A0ABP7ABC7_9MICO